MLIAVKLILTGKNFLLNVYRCVCRTRTMGNLKAAEVWVMLTTNSVEFVYFASLIFSVLFLLFF